MQIATDLDRLEREVMAEGGLESEAYLRYAAEDSGNVAADGMFSSQVRAARMTGAYCTACLTAPRGQRKRGCGRHVLLPGALRLCDRRIMLSTLDSLKWTAATLLRLACSPHRYSPLVRCVHVAYCA